MAGYTFSGGYNAAGSQNIPGSLVKRPMFAPSGGGAALLPYQQNAIQPYQVANAVHNVAGIANAHRPGQLKPASLYQQLHPAQPVTPFGDGTQSYFGYQQDNHKNYAQMVQNAQASIHRLTTPDVGHGGFFKTPYSSTGWAFRNANGDVEFDTQAPGKHARVVGALPGMGLDDAARRAGMSLKDARQFFARSGSNLELANALRPILAAMADLKSGGMKQYRTRNDELTRSWMDNKDAQNAALAAHGIYSSGYRGNLMGDLGVQLANRRSELSDQFGQNALRRLGDQSMQVRQNHFNDLTQMLLAAVNNKRATNASLHAFGG